MQNIEKIEEDAKLLLSENPAMVKKISAALGIKEESSHKALCEVLKFLSLIELKKESLTPSLKVDLAWHEFILFTRVYHKYCDKSFGRYIHHNPGGNEEDNLKKFKKTLFAYHKHFGTAPEEFWGSHINPFEAECGAYTSFKEAQI